MFALLFIYFFIYRYVAPEVLGFSGGFMIDWWSLGILVFELLTGAPPWKTKDRKELFKQIREVAVEAPKHASGPAGDLMLGLLNRNPSKRLGAMGDAKQVKVRRSSVSIIFLLSFSSLFFSFLFCSVFHLK